MKWAALAMIGIGAASISTADTPREPPVKCNDGGTTLEMAACARDAFEESDRRLNATYHELIGKEATNTVFVKKLREAQTAWIKFRDAELAATFACEEANHSLCWGSMYPLDFLALKKRLTDERESRLREMLERGRP
jgi:uncharacterized protein YecT (DUF1311 family)